MRGLTGAFVRYSVGVLASNNSERQVEGETQSGVGMDHSNSSIISSQRSTLPPPWVATTSSRVLATMDYLSLIVVDEGAENGTVLKD